MDNNFLKSPNSKLFYRPIEVAVRWCGLMNFETAILGAVDDHYRPNFKSGAFPCIKNKLEILLDAMTHQELPYGCLGISVPAGTSVEPIFVTVRHIDLRNWFKEYYPLEKPDFLFS